MASINITYDEEIIRTISIARRAIGGAWAPEKICEVHLQMHYRRDSFNRGLGDIWAMGFGETEQLAFDEALKILTERYEGRLAERNAIPPGSIPVRGLRQDNVVSDEKLAAIASKLNISLDL